MKRFLFLALLIISNMLHAENWTGTGWALKDGYIVTNFHCVDGSRSILVNTPQRNYTAKVVATDPSSDLAIIKISDDKFSGFGEIPYSIARKQCEVGETVWTLGFPMTSIMGDEVKFTDGKISAKTGYMGDLSTYQITVPIHPGNSGGPLFNKNGDIVGVTSSGLDKQLADNVNYAIKANYLLNLIESALSVEIIPNGSVKNLALTEYIQRNKKYVFLLYFSSESHENAIAEVEAETRVEKSPTEEPTKNSAIVDFLEYVKIAENKVKITKYTGNWQEVEIPSVIMKDGIKFYVTEIATKAFNQKVQLKKITIPSTIETIEYRAFWLCSNLQTIKVMTGNTTYDSRNNCNAIIETKTNTLIIGCQKTIIPNNVTSIGMGAFYECSSLTSITIPNSVTSVGTAAFSGCTALTSITIPNSVTSVGTAAFFGCTALTSITIPNSVTSVERNVFSRCTALTSITIPNSVTSVGEAAFSGCTALTSTTIPNSVTSVGKAAFFGCTALTSITIPNSVESIGDQAFYNCKSLTSITIPNSVESIGNHAFEGCRSLTSITIGESVTNIGHEAFSGCSSLTSITIPNSVTSIGKSTFSDCSSLSSITIPNSVAEIGEKAFFKCVSLEKLELGNVKKIGAKAFEYCTSLNAITLSDSLKEIQTETFKDCQSLTSITIPLNVTTIEEKAFVGCTSLTSVVWNAMSGSATIIDGNRIGSPFFDILPQISSVTFGNQVKLIPSHLCSGMYNLHSIIIPKNVKKIEKKAFQCAPQLWDGYNLQIVFEGKVDVLSEMCGSWGFFSRGKRIITIYSSATYVEYYKSLKDEMFNNIGQKVKVIIKKNDN